MSGPPVPGSEPLVDVRPDPLGRRGAGFTDAAGRPCMLHESSLGPCVWLGTSKAPMHVSRELAAELAVLLAGFAEKGTLENPS